MEAKNTVTKTVYPIIISLCGAHFINDLLQVVLQTSFPEFQANYALSYFQVGLITLVFQLSSSVLQPIVGNYTDKHPQPYSFIVGMSITSIGIVLLAFSVNYSSILIAAAFIGTGSAIFHPEASKLAFYVAGGKRGWAQSIFQIGGRLGTAFGPLLFILIVIPNGQKYIVAFVGFALIGIILLTYVGKWYKKFLKLNDRIIKKAKKEVLSIPKKKVRLTLFILMVLIFSKFFYIATIKNYLLLYLIDKFDFSQSTAQAYLFTYLVAAGIGVLIGGRLADRFGRKYVIWFSILGVAPFTLFLPFATPFWTLILLIIIGVILASAFPTIIVYAQELMPGKTGMVSGLFYGFAFGMGGVGAALLGILADNYGLQHVFIWCSFLPFIGLLAVFLPNLRRLRQKTD